MFWRCGLWAVTVVCVSVSFSHILLIWSLNYIDVGGGSVPDAEENELGNISLRWMVKEVMKTQCGILFDEAALKRSRIPRHVFPAGVIDLPSSNNLDGVHDNEDALEPLHDELKASPLWWLLELLPLSYSWQDPEGVWHRTYR